MSTPVCARCAGLISVPVVVVELRDLSWPGCALDCVALPDELGPAPEEVAPPDAPAPDAPPPLPPPPPPPPPWAKAVDEMATQVRRTASDVRIIRFPQLREDNCRSLGKFPQGKTWRRRRKQKTARRRSLKTHAMDCTQATSAALRRRIQPSNPPNARIAPGRPAPTVGPGTGAGAVVNDNTTPPLLEP